jgi:hypothetical protein
LEDDESSKRLIGMYKTKISAKQCDCVTNIIIVHDPASRRQNLFDTLRNSNSKATHFPLTLTFHVTPQRLSGNVAIDLNALEALASDPPNLIIIVAIIVLFETKSSNMSARGGGVMGHAWNFDRSGEIMLSKTLED